jgi:hypothetical protein
MPVWMVKRGELTFGPVSSENLQQKAESGELLPTDQIKQQGHFEWRSASSVKGLKFKTRSGPGIDRTDRGQGGQRGPTPPMPPPPVPGKSSWYEKPKVRRAGQVLLVTVLVVGVPWLGIAAYRYFKTENVSEKSDQQDPARVAEDDPKAEDDPQSLDNIIAEINKELGSGYVEESLYIGASSRKCYEDQVFLANARAAAAKAELKKINDRVAFGADKAKEVQGDFDFLVGEYGFLAAKAKVDFIRPIETQGDGEVTTQQISFEVRVDVIEFYESAPEQGSVVASVRQQYLNDAPVPYQATLTPKELEGTFVIDTHQVNGPLDSVTIKDVIRRNVSTLLSLKLPGYAKTAVADAF